MSDDVRKPIWSSHRSRDGINSLGPNHVCGFCGQRKAHVVGIHMSWICEECCDCCYEIFSDAEARRAAEHLAAKQAARAALEKETDT